MVPHSNQPLASTLVSFVFLPSPWQLPILPYPMMHPTVCFLLSCPKVANHAGENHMIMANVCHSNVCFLTPAKDLTLPSNTSVFLLPFHTPAVLDLYHNPQHTCPSTMPSLSLSIDSLSCKLEKS